MSLALLEKPRTYTRIFELNVVPNGGLATALTQSGDLVTINVYNAGSDVKLGEQADTGVVYLLHPADESTTNSYRLGNPVCVRWM